MKDMAAGTENLAGQQAACVEEQPGLFNKRERNNGNAVMHSVASEPTRLEIRSLAQYPASLP